MSIGLQRPRQNDDHWLLVFQEATGVSKSRVQKRQCYRAFSKLDIFLSRISCGLSYLMAISACSLPTTYFVH